MNRLRVAVVMPPATDLEHGAALEMWPTFTKCLEALRATGDVDPVGCCRTTSHAAMVVRHGIQYYFETDDRQLARRVAAVGPDVVHLHGLGFTSLLVRLRHAVGPRVPILMQHHGEPPPADLRVRFAQRTTRRFVAGYLFTGAAGQAEPFRQAGVISRSAPTYEVLESASNVEDVQPVDHPHLGGDPCVLWVGRLIPSKDPLCAVRAVAAAREHGSGAELHMLATDRTMEAEVSRLIDSSGLTDVVHVHPPVAFAEMAAWYRRADFYLSTSHREGSNFSLIESLGFGCRPVVTEIPSHAEIVRRLAPRFAVGAAEAAGALLGARPSVSREEVTAHSQQFLSWTNVAEQLVGTYRRGLRA